jgi:dihydrodipicolinate reductase
MSKNQQNIRVGILGVTGRMGQMLVQASIQADYITVATAEPEVHLLVKNSVHISIETP